MIRFVPSYAYLYKIVNTVKLKVTGFVHSRNLAVNCLNCGKEHYIITNQLCIS